MRNDGHATTRTVVVCARALRSSISRSLAQMAFILCTFRYELRITIGNNKKKMERNNT